MLAEVAGARLQSTCRYGDRHTRVIRDGVFALIHSTMNTSSEGSSYAYAVSM